MTLKYLTEESSFEHEILVIISCMTIIGFQPLPISISCEISYQITSHTLRPRTVL